MKLLLPITLLLVSLVSCKTEHHKENSSLPLPSVEQNGKRIVFPDNQRMLAFFHTNKLTQSNLSAHYTAPASVAVTIAPSAIKEARETVLFDNTELASAYSQFLQHLININSFRITLDRVKDLSQHGAATGKEVLEAQTLLDNEEAAITEQEARFEIAGFDPAVLKKPVGQQAWLLCEVPESQISNVKIGTACSVTFTAYPNEVFNAKVSGLGTQVDNVTRMIKVRIDLPNRGNRFQVGMFANVTFQMREGSVLAIPPSAIVNVQGKDYAFVQASENVFDRREILVGQQLDNVVTILHGLDPGDHVVVKGAMQLKGLSFGY